MDSATLGAGVTNRTSKAIDESEYLPGICTPGHGFPAFVWAISYSPSRYFTKPLLAGPLGSPPVCGPPKSSASSTVPPVVGRELAASADGAPATEAGACTDDGRSLGHAPGLR